MAGMIWADVTLDTALLDNLAASTQAIAHNAAAEESADVVRGCKRRSRVRSGRMKRGWTRAAIGPGRAGGFRIYDPIPWTIYNEFGTRKMSAQPMLGPEMRAARGRFPARVKKWMHAGVRHIVSTRADTAGETLSENQL